MTATNTMTAAELTAVVRDLLDRRVSSVSALRAAFDAAKLSKAEWIATAQSFGYTLGGTKADIKGRFHRNLEGIAMSFYRAEVILSCC